MALWFVSYATSPITVTIYDVSIVIVYDVTLLLSMTYHFQSRLGKTDCTDIWVIKLKNQVSPSIGFRVPHFAPCKPGCTTCSDDRQTGSPDENSGCYKFHPASDWGQAPSFDLQLVYLETTECGLHSVDLRKLRSQLLAVFN